MQTQVLLMCNWLFSVFKGSCQGEQERLKKMLSKHPAADHPSWYHESSAPVPVMGDDWHVRHNRRAQHYGQQYWSNPLAEHPADLIEDCPIRPMEALRKEREECQLHDIHDPGQVTFADLAK